VTARETDERPQGLGAAARTVAEHASAIARLEIELAAMEIKRKLVALGLGVAFAAGAAIVLLFVLGFAFAAAAAAFATFLSIWLALLVVAAILLAVAGLLVVLAIGRFRKGTPPLPQQAIREAKLTTEALKRDGSGT
jgi:protein-S-isoprenylcysteine O-methyltransferase Ste14